MKNKILWLLLLSYFYAVLAVAGMYGRKLCKEEGFECVRVKGRQSWHSLFPDEHDRGIVMRINRMNTSVYPGITIAVPDDLEAADIMDFSPFPLNVPAPGEKVVIVDPVDLAWGAYDESGMLVRWGPASAGAFNTESIFSASK